MRLRTTLAMIGLVAAMGMLSGCCVCAPVDHTHGPVESLLGEPWLRSGVVKAERDGVVVGYMCTDSADEAQANWVLESAHWLPLDIAGDGKLTLTGVEVGRMSLEDLCAWVSALPTPGDPDTATPPLAGPADGWTVRYGERKRVGACDEIMSQ